MEPCSVPGIQAIGDDVLGLAQPRVFVDRGQAAGGGRPGRYDGRVQGFFPAEFVEPYPQEDAVVVGGQGFPARERCAVQGESVPVADQRSAPYGAVGKRCSEMGACSGSGVDPAVGAAPEHDFPAGDGAGQGAIVAEGGGCADDVPVPDGRARACWRACAMRPGFASRQVGRCRSQGTGRRRSESGSRARRAEGSGVTRPPPIPAGPDPPPVQLRAAQGRGSGGGEA